MIFNQFGKVKKQEVIDNGLIIFEEKNGLLTYSELKKQMKSEYGILIDWGYEEREQHATAWLCNSANMGCSPIYLLDEIYLDLFHG